MKLRVVLRVLTAGESSFPNPKQSAWLVAYKALADAAGKLSLFVITVVAARRLSPHAFGVFSLGSTVGWLAAVAADSGIQMHLARAVARTPADAESLLRGWLRVRFWTAAGAIALVSAGVLAASSFAESAGPIIVLALVYGASGLIEFLHYCYRGLSRSDIESSLTLSQRSATLVLGLAALAWRPTVGALALAMLVPALITLLISLRIALRLDRLHLSPAMRESIDDSSVAARHGHGDFWRDVFPIGAGILLSALYFRVDIVLVQWWAGTESVAMYNAVFRLVEALRLFPAAVLAVALPSLCRSRDWRAVTTVSVGLTVFGLVTAVVLAWNADWIVPLVYGRHYAPAAPAFRILLYSLPLLSLNYALTQQLIGWDRQRAYATLCAIALVVNLALNSKLIPALSIEGAAWSTLGTEAALTAGCLVALLGRAQAIAQPIISDRVTT